MKRDFSIKNTNNQDSDIAVHRVNKSFAIDTIVPFFSLRKLRVIYHELQGNADFEFLSFEAFKQSVLASNAPQLELSKWQAIASRR